MAINSKVELCNMAISHLGNYGTVENIDEPKTDKEVTCALWYDVALEYFLKIAMPNFAMSRKTVAALSETPPSSFTFVYEYPNDCLKVLGIDDVELRKNDYTVEGNRIYTSVEYTGGLPIRYIKKFTDVTLMSPEFKIEFSWFLASLIALDVTQDLQKAKMIEDMVPSKIAVLSGMNAQENRPIRISASRFKQSRYTGFVSDDNKK